MKVWQLAAVLADERSIGSSFFARDIVLTGQDCVPEQDVIELLSKSNKRYQLDSQNTLRLADSGSFGTIVCEMTALDAYQRFGGDAVTEVNDYGSFNVEKLRNR